MPTPSDRPSDELIYQYLGAAVTLCWAELPSAARDQILRQADDVIGLAPIAQPRNEIVKLMLRRAKAQWAASLASVRSLQGLLACDRGPSGSATSDPSRKESAASRESASDMVGG